MNRSKYLSQLIFTTALSFFAVCGYSQTRFTLSVANRFYDHYHYASAIPLYESWMKRHPSDNVVLVKLADSYRKVNDSRNGETAYKKLVEADSKNKSFLLNYASMLALNGKYNESARYFEMYKDNGGDTRGELYTKAFSNLYKLFKDSAQVVIRPLLTNSYQHDFSPAFYNGGLIFCSDRTSEKHLRNTFDWNHSGYLDLYFISDTTTISGAKISTSAKARKKREVTSSHHSDYTYVTSNDTRTVGYYQKPVHEDSFKLSGITLSKFEPLNTKYHEGPLVFYSGSDTVLFTRNNYVMGKYKTDKAGANRLKLLMARLSGDTWIVQEFKYNSNEYSTGHPALSSDNKTLYFISDMPGGKGGTDIWRSEWKKNAWSKPVNVEVVNTEGNEMFPFVDGNGNLFFASNGWGGLGGLDVFYSRIRNSVFEVPRNLGFPINSMKDDFGMIVNKDGRSGYLSSARNWEKSMDDIFYFKSNLPLVRVYTLKGKAIEDQTNMLLPNTLVSLLDENAKTAASQVTGEDGSYTFPIEPGLTYSLTAEKEDYFPFSKPVSTSGIEPGESLSVYAFLPKKGQYAISCNVTDSKSGQMIDSVKFVLKEMRSKSVLTQSKDFGKGTFRLPLVDIKKGDVFDLQLQLTAKGYLSKTVGYRAVFQEPGELKLHEVLDLTLEKIDLGADIGKLLKVKPIYFDLGKSVIRADAAKELDKIVEVMKENKGMKIELGSHTDSRGSDQSNLLLSDKRAKASAAYIVSKGISADRITGKGYGESRLVNQCVNGAKCSETDHQLNRRTEFIVISLE